jgi:tetratricopeptide (TPR) repeat protein
MKAIKYFFVGALMLGFSAQVMAQDVKSKIDAITKVIVSNNGAGPAVKDAVKVFVKENKKNAEALAGLGRAYLDIKDQTNALKYADMAIKANKNNAAGYLLKGDMAAINDNGGEAAMWYQTATQLDPKNPQGYIKYARVYQKVDAAGAEEMLRKLKSIDPNYPVDAEIAHMYYANNKFAKALENYQKVNKAKLGDDKLTEYALAAYFLGKSAESLEAAEYGANKFPRSAGLNRLSFYNHTDLKNYDKALQFADRLFNKSDSAKFVGRDYLYFGHALKGGGRYAEAIQNFQKTYDLDNTQNDVLKLISDSYLESKNHDKAVEYYQKYINTQEKKKASDYGAIARIYIDLAETETNQAAKEAALLKADQAYADLAAAMPSNEDYAAYQRAHIHHMINPDIKKGAAKPFYEKCVQILEPKADRAAGENTTLAEAYNYLTVYYIQNDQVSKAKEYAAKLQSLQPDNETAKQVLGLK